jgi:hypothetical protein
MQVKKNLKLYLKIMKRDNYLVIFHSKEIDSNIFIRVEACAKDAIKKAITQIYTPLYVSYLKDASEFVCFEDYVSSSLESDNLFHVATITNPGTLVNVDYFQLHTD